jgi:Rieske Fe-S protein
MSAMTNPAITRRTMLTRAALTGAAAVGVTSALVACGDGDPPATSNGGGATGSPTTVKSSQVPVGGGTIVAQVVVTQPTEGTYKAFSAVCTHQGCLVGAVVNSTILCSCHNSQFSAADGSVLSGPAPRALIARSVSVSGGTLAVI